MAKIYKTLLQEGRGEFSVSRSRFIGWAKPVSAEKDALTFIEKISKSHRDANHNVWAYVLGTAKERYSDDGEPQGTAGLPVLDLIRKEELRDLVVMVTRYFGGVKLGTGGLVRAYTQSAKIALDAGKIIERRPYLSFDIETEYALADKFQREFDRRGYRLKNKVYLEKVLLTVLVPPEESEALEKLTAEFTAGTGSLTAGLEEYLNFLQGAYCDQKAVE